MNIFEKMQLHFCLNPKIWYDDNTLRPEVHEKITDIVEEFKEYCDIDFSVADIQIVGSNASYNYTDHSDLDVHLIVNFEEIDASTEITQLLFNNLKASFNSAYDISIHGVPVEIYVEDINSGVTSNGIYSVLENKWIKFPKPIKVKDYDTTEQLQEWEIVADNAIDNADKLEIQDCINRLYMMRKNSIAADGEYGFGNQLFKDIRDVGILQDLKDALKDIKTSELSLESLDRNE